MKKKYLTPQTESMIITLEKHLLDASLRGSTGESLSGTKDSYDWDWDEV